MRIAQEQDQFKDPFVQVISSIISLCSGLVLMYAGACTNEQGKSVGLT
jgi:hypothetical protein